MLEVHILHVVICICMFEALRQLPRAHVRTCTPSYKSAFKYLDTYVHECTQTYVHAITHR